METIEIAQLCARYADDKKAEDIVLLDLRGLSPVTDFFVICTATSNPQMRAVRDEIIEQMRDQHGLKPLFHEGGYESQWLIVNFPNVMVHILSPEKREYYSLEELWGDAPRLAFDTAPPPPPKKRAVKKTAAKKTPRKKGGGQSRQEGSAETRLRTVTGQGRAAGPRGSPGRSLLE